MKRSSIVALGLGMTLAAHAESTVFPGITTLRVKPLSCREVTFGQDAFEPATRLDAEERFTGVLLSVDVRESVTRDFDGRLMSDVPTWRRPQGLTSLVLEGRAAERCPQLQQAELALRIQPRDCDTLPARGKCLIPFMPLVEIETPAQR